MSVQTFNFCLLIGWLMATIGGMFVDPGAGLCVGGLLLISLTIFMAKFGGLYAEKDKG